MNNQKLILAVLASTASAGYSDYKKDWYGKLHEIYGGENCNNGPQICEYDEYGNDLECPIGYACNDDTEDAWCMKVNRYTSYKTCEDGLVKDPLKYSDCITVEARDAMFCNPNDGAVA